MYRVAVVDLSLLGAGGGLGHTGLCSGVQSGCRGNVLAPKPLPLSSHSPDHCGVQLPSVEEDAVEGGSQAALPQHSKGGSDNGLI